jgi:hypothetical protein
MVPYKLCEMKIPTPSPDITFVQTSMYDEFKRYFANPDGITVFFAPPHSGKLLTLGHIDPPNTVFWDCRLSPDFSSFFKQLGLDPDTEKSKLFNICQQKITVVLYHFDDAIDKRFLSYVCDGFNVFVLCDTHQCALEVLRNFSGHVKLLGTPYCGKWCNISNTSDINEIAIWQLNYTWETAEKELLDYRIARREATNFVVDVVDMKTL